jgi:hypothetical protein
MKKNFKWFAVLMCLSCFLTGCEIMDDDFSDLFKEPDTPEEEQPKFVITVNEIIKYPRATKLEREIATFSGRTIWIKKYKKGQAPSQQRQAEFL